MFYAAISSEIVPEHFDLISAQRQVKNYLAAILKPEETELAFWRTFAEGKAQPFLSVEKKIMLVLVSDTIRHGTKKPGYRLSG